MSTPTPSERKPPVTKDDDNAQQQAKLRKKLDQLTSEHADLDAVINEMLANPLTDMVRLQRLKKRKLGIKDEIRSIQRRLLPDIIA